MNKRNILKDGSTRTAAPHNLISVCFFILNSIMKRSQEQLVTLGLKRGTTLPSTVTYIVSLLMSQRNSQGTIWQDCWSLWKEVNNRLFLRRQCFAFRDSAYVLLYHSEPSANYCSIPVIFTVLTKRNILHCTVNAFWQ